MLLTITTTRQPATDLGYLLHKHPAKVQEVELAKGTARLFYTEASKERCTLAMAIEVDPIALIRNSGNMAESFSLGQYVNDRPYAASSIFSNALSKCFSSAMNGRCKDKPELVDEAMPFEVKIAVLPVRGGEAVLKQLLEPLGYTVQAERHVLDEQFNWGDSRYYTVTLRNTCKLSDLLSHLYVLVPVFDNNKHYWIGEGEVDKLLDKGEGWLDKHPAKDMITRRYLRNLGGLTKRALLALNIDEEPIDDSDEDAQDAKPVSETKVRLHDQRLETVKQELLNTGAKRVLDLGCGEGKLLRLLLPQKQFEYILGMDVSAPSIEIAKERLNFEKLSTKYKERISLIQGALTYRDKRLQGFDAAALVEVIEHLDEPRLEALTANVFGSAMPTHIVITTPNKEYNSMYENMAEDAMRHSDHRFEWTRAEFEAWGNAVAAQYGYTVSYKPVGEVDAQVGAPSQMALFSKKIISR